jgi:hypothetical protein
VAFPGPEGRIGHPDLTQNIGQIRVWIRHAGADVASYPRSWDRGRWFPPPQLRPEPPAPAPVTRLAVPAIAPPELTDYAELCA